jgi:cell division protein FtsZ
MIHFDLPPQKSSIIKVLGVGGGGSNAVTFMHSQDIEGVDFIICNTDSKALENSQVPNKIQLGPHLTQGLGAGANPEVGKQATEESLEEIRRILEVNTKMAFITAGMGGGTGTGGAPIVAQICREMGILTVGIVTTPFGFEGPRRLSQAEEGIRRLQPFVDTLLVISNDKLREKYGNLKMREAFSKADNVLATAAKCITDIINSRGHIIVDFADVCTVMKEGGVAILGSAEAEGENRALEAIEQALNSPLLNDNDISGAKWILININSAEGDFECTMDEMDAINKFVRQQAGPDTDVIIGMGFDASLDKKIGLTLIATGFDQKDPFAALRPQEKKPEPVKKIVLKLSDTQTDAAISIAEKAPELTVNINDNFAPTLRSEEQPSDLFSNQVEESKAEGGVLRMEWDVSETTQTPEIEVAKPDFLELTYTEKTESSEVAKERGFLSRPDTVYAATPAQAPPQEDAPTIVKQDAPTLPFQESEFKKDEVSEDAPMPVLFLKQEEDDEETAGIGFVIKEEIDEQTVTQQPINVEMTDEEIKRRIAQERIQRLRNLSFNMNSNDANAELENVPAYVRRNMELFGNNNLATVEDFYSKITVNKGSSESNAQIGTLNTFLEGEQPD